MKIDEQPAGAADEVAQHGALARVTYGPRGELLWRPLAEAWLANKVAQSFELHVKGGYAWNASRYLPVFVRGEDGDAFLSFRRGR